MSSPGIYVHYPFCITKCSYCAFCSVEHSDELEDMYADALIREIRATLPECSPRTIYAGGGTPTLMSPERWGDILREVSSVSGEALPVELTIEANPGTLTYEYLIGLRAIGFNRLSIGVQSFSPTDLELLGRIHSPGQARDSIRMARDAGFQNLGIDLIYGIPGQDAIAWGRSLQETVEMSPEHISCYELSFEPGTPLGEAAASGALDKAGDGKCSQMYSFAHELLTGAGYLHYEVSNFARGEEHISKHNSSYWDRTPYFGLGAAAHSFDGEFTRSWNTADIRRYIELLNGGLLPTENLETLSREDVATEMLMLGLRWMKGIDLDRLADVTGHAVDPGYLNGMLDAGRAIMDGSVVVPTPLGMLFADRDAVGLLG